ncbi:MAG: hypothetical protein ACFFEF_17610 [Candidatus Thorarchaeota archaeon]
MRDWWIRAKVLGCLLIVFVGGISAVTFIGLPYYPNAYRTQTDTYPHSFILSNDTPKWNETPEGFFAEEIGLVYLQTNNTPVNILFLTQSMEAVLSLYNVTKITDIIISTNITEETSIIVERVVGDVEVELTILVLSVIPPPPTAIQAGPAAAILFCLFFVFIGILLLFLVKAESHWILLKGNRQPALISFLLIVSILLMTPSIVGTLNGSFALREQIETVGSESKVFVLNSSNPSDFVEIGGEADYDNYTIQKGPQNNGEMAYRIMIQDSQGSILVDATFVNSSLWMIEGIAANDTSYFLYIQRAGSDEEVELMFSNTKVMMKPNLDPTVSNILAILGSALFALALVLGFNTKTKDGTQRASVV